MNTLGIDTLQKEKTQLQEDFNKLGVQIKQVEIDLGQMKANLNAINGAIQEVNKLIGLVENQFDPENKPKEAGVNITNNKPGHYDKVYEAENKAAQQRENDNKV